MGGSSSVVSNRYRASSAMDDDNIKAMSAAVVRHRDSTSSFILEKVDIPVNKISGRLRKGAVSPDVLDVPVLDRYPFVDYRFMKKIGEGTHSIVYKAVNVADDQFNVAIKEVRINEMSKVDQENFHYEMNVLSQLHHPNILRVAAVYQPISITKPQAKLYIASEYLRGGELLPTLCAQKHFYEQDIRHHMADILSALSYLHSRGVVHGRLIPENIVLSQPGFRTAPVKLVDFSHADCVSSRRKTFDERDIDAPFMAPELFLADGTRNWKNLTSAADVWSFGRIVSVLLTGTYPQLNTINDQKDGNVLFYNDKWTHISKECKALIDATQHMDPSKRPTAHELLDFDWFGQPFYEINLSSSRDSFDGAVLARSLSDDSKQLINLADHIPDLIDYMNERVLSTSLLVSSGVVRFMKVGRYRQEQKMARINFDSPFVPVELTADDE